MLILLRHGRTTSNALGLFQGRSDTELDQVGQLQAAAAAKAIGSVDRVVSSPLRRAAQTADRISLRSGGLVEFDERLEELDYGDLDGLPLGDLSPESWIEWQSNSDFALPGGESLTDLHRRVRDCLDDLADSARSGNVVVVSHMSPIKSAVQWALGTSVELTWRLHLSTGSITRIDFRGSRAVLMSFNDISHHPAQPQRP